MPYQDGIGNVIVDTLYIYFFPFVFLFLLIRLGFRLLGAGYRVVWGRDKEGGSAADLVQKLQPLTVPGTVQPANAPNAASTTPQIEGARFRWRSLAERISLPFRQFTLLWCFLLLLTSRPLLLWVALAIVITHVVRFLIAVTTLVLLSSNWLTEIESKVKKYAEGLIQQVVSAKEITPDMRQTWMYLTVLEVGLTLLRNRRRVMQWTIYLGMLFFSGLYLYLSLLFSFVYYGIARVQDIPYSWTAAAVTSVFIPFAYGDLPHNVWLKLVGGVHAAVIILLGAGTVFGYLQRKLNSLHSAAESLATRLDQEEVRGKLALMKSTFETAPKPPTSRAP